MIDLRERFSEIKNPKDRGRLIKQCRRRIENVNQLYSSKEFKKIGIPLSYASNPKAPIEVYRSRDYLVQVYNDKKHVRISIARTGIKDSGDWEDGISWDEIMRVKSSIGFGDYDAVEVYPKDRDVVNVANIRHLFLLNDSPSFIWRPSKGEPE